jgi:ubiquinone/menaquinone biosynthesis C-methylase UbiE
MKKDPDYNEYLGNWSELYEEKNYEKGLSGYYLSKSHQWCEQYFGSHIHMNNILEVGAGTGIHLEYVRHSFDNYTITDFNTEFLEKLTSLEYGNNSREVIVKQEDASNLTFSDHTFDRVIAAHVLEHLKDPHLVLREWVRV